VLQPAVAVVHGVEHEQVALWAACPAPCQKRMASSQIFVCRPAAGRRRTSRRRPPPQSGAARRAALNSPLQNRPFPPGSPPVRRSRPPGRAKALRVDFSGARPVATSQAASARVPPAPARVGRLPGPHAQAQAGAVEKAACRRPARRCAPSCPAHRPRTQHQRLAGIGVDRQLHLSSCCTTCDPRPCPGGPAASAGFWKLAHQVAARNPDRQRHRCGGGLGNGQRDAEQVGVQHWGFNAVVNAPGPALVFLRRAMGDYTQAMAPADQGCRRLTWLRPGTSRPAGR
jgi:hypothetical protein